MGLSLMENRFHEAKGTDLGKLREVELYVGEASSNVIEALCFRADCRSCPYNE